MTGVGSDELIGAWLVLGTRRIDLRADGAAEFFSPGCKTSRVGSWRRIDAGHFETVEPIPGNSQWTHSPDGYDDRTHYAIVELGVGRMVVVGYEGGADGLERDPVVWTRAADPA